MIIKDSKWSWYCWGKGAGCSNVTKLVNEKIIRPCSVTKAMVRPRMSGAGVPWWTNRYIACGYGYGYGVAVDVSNNVFVTGSSVGSGV